MQKKYLRLGLYYVPIMRSNLCYETATAKTLKKKKKELTDSYQNKVQEQKVHETQKRTGGECVYEDRFRARMANPRHAHCYFSSPRTGQHRQGTGDGFGRALGKDSETSS